MSQYVKLPCDVALNLLKYLSKDGYDSEKLEILKKSVQEDEIVIFPIGVADVDYEIMQWLDDKQLLTVCKINNYTANLCRDELFWSKRIETSFDIDIKYYKPPNVSYKEIWKNLIKKRTRLSYVISWGINPLIEKFWDSEIGGLIYDDEIINSLKNKVFTLETLILLEKLNKRYFYIFMEIEYIRKFLKNGLNDIILYKAKQIDQTDNHAFSNISYILAKYNSPLTLIEKFLDIAYEKTESDRESYFVDFFLQIKDITLDNFIYFCERYNIKIDTIINKIEQKLSSERLGIQSSVIISILEHFNIDLISIMKKYEKTFLYLLDGYLLKMKKFSEDILNEAINQENIDAQTLAFIYKNSFHHENEVVSRKYLRRITNLLEKQYKKR